MWSSYDQWMAEILAAKQTQWNPGPPGLQRSVTAGAKDQSHYILFRDESLITKSLWLWPRVCCKKNQLQGSGTDKHCCQSASVLQSLVWEHAF